MSNQLYPKYKESLLGAGVNLVSGVVKVALVDLGTYTYGAAHQFFSSITGVIGTPLTLGSKTVVNGVFGAANPTFGATSGVSGEALVLYVDTGVAGTSPLVAYIDTATGLPVTPNGGVIDLTLNGSGIFAI